MKPAKPTKLVPQLMTPRKAAGLTRVPWDELRALLQENGFHIHQFGDRERVAVDDLAALLEQSRQPTPAEAADRLGVAIALAAAEMGIKVRSRGRGRRSHGAAKQGGANGGG